MNSQELEKVTKDLSEKLDILHKVKKVNSHLKKTNERIRSSESLRKSLEMAISREEKDMEKLEKASIKSMFYNVLGSKEQQIEKQRQEHLEASLRYNDLLKSLEMLYFEKDILVKRLKEIGHIQSDIESLINKKEQLIINSGDDSRLQIVNIIKEQRKKNAMFKEINEAVISGIKAQKILAQMIRLLQSAMNWGQWDMSGRNKLLTGNHKNNNVDKARKLANQAKHKLIKFQDELKDVYGYHDYNLSFRMENFSRFTDIFFDNLISDWIIQQKIKNTVNSIQTTYDKVSRLISSVKKEEQTLEQSIIELEEQKRNLIIEY